MATAADYLTTARDNAAQRLSELDTVAVTTRVRMSYSIDGVSYDWNGYRAALINQVKELNSLIQQSDAPFEVHAGHGA